MNMKKLPDFPIKTPYNGTLYITKFDTNEVYISTQGNEMLSLKVDKETYTFRVHASFIVEEGTANVKRGGARGGLQINWIKDGKIHIIGSSYARIPRYDQVKEWVRGAVLSWMEPKTDDDRKVHQQADRALEAMSIHDQDLEIQIQERQLEELRGIRARNAKRFEENWKVSVEASIAALPEDKEKEG